MADKRQCPKCGGTNVKPSFSNPSTTIEGGKDDWICMDCNYVGVMPEHNPDIPEDKFKGSEIDNTQDSGRDGGLGLILVLVVFILLLAVLRSLI